MMQAADARARANLEPESHLYSLPCFGPPCFRRFVSHMGFSESMRGSSCSSCGAWRVISLSGRGVRCTEALLTKDQVAATEALGGGILFKFYGDRLSRILGPWIRILGFGPRLLDLGEAVLRIERVKHALDWLKLALDEAGSRIISIFRRSRGFGEGSLPF